MFVGAEETQWLRGHRFLGAWLSIWELALAEGRKRQRKRGCERNREVILLYGL